MKKSTTFRLSEDAKLLLAKLSEKDGISQASVLELAIRKEAALQNIVLEKPPKQRSPKRDPTKVS